MKTGKTIAAHGQIAVRSTTPEDVDFVLETERHAHNTPFIREWSREKHCLAINDPSIAHWIVEAKPNGHPVGYVILLGVGNNDGSVEFKRIAIAEKGKGFGRDAVRIIKKVAFEQLGVHRVWLEVVEHNLRAKHIYESEGFVCEGVHREAARMLDKYESLIVMSMLECEYHQAENAT
jgi:diamine N-acetyltransferase